MQDNEKSGLGFIVGLVLTVIFVVTVIFGSWFTVGETERAVVLRNGAFNYVASPGLHFKMPILDSVTEMDVTTHSIKYKDINAYTKDQQTAVMALSVTYAVQPGQVEEAYKQYKAIESLQARLLDRQVNTQLENVFGQYTAIEAVQKRIQLGVDYGNALKAAVVGPITIISVQIENIDFDSRYEKAIADRMEAEVKITTENQNLVKEKVLAEITVMKAKAEADSSLARAKASAEAVKIQGEAEASAIRAKASALAENGNLVALIKAERWNGQLPTTMLPNNAVPFIDVK